MTFDVFDILLAVVLAAAITVAIASPRLRTWAAGVALAVAGVFTGRFGRREPDDVAEETPDSTPILDPTTDLQEELHDAHDDIDLVPDDDLDAAAAAYDDRTADRE